MAVLLSIYMKASLRRSRSTGCEIVFAKVSVQAIVQVRVPARGSGSCGDFSISHGQWPIPL